jgi:hypothetical protein
MSLPTAKKVARPAVAVSFTLSSLVSSPSKNVKATKTAQVVESAWVSDSNTEKQEQELTISHKRRRYSNSPKADKVQQDLEP